MGNPCFRGEQAIARTYSLIATMVSIKALFFFLTLFVPWNEALSQGVLPVDKHDSIAFPHQRFHSVARFGSAKDSSVLIITQYSSFVVDSLQRITIHRILREFHSESSRTSAPTIQFHNASNEPLQNLGYVFPAVWVRFSVRRVQETSPFPESNAEFEQQRWKNIEPFVLSLGNRDADSVELYIVRRDTLVYADTVGFSVAYNKWKLPASQIAFNLPPLCNTGDEYDIYIRFCVRDIFLYSIKLRTREVFISEEFELLKRFLIFLGIAIFAILFNLLVWISTKSRYHGIYIAYVASKSLWLIVTYGFWHQLFKITTPSLYTALDNITYGLSTILGVLFITNLVREQKLIQFNRLWYWTEYCFYTFCVIGVVLRISKLDRFIDILPYSYLFLAIPLTLGISYRAWRQGYSPALYLLIARVTVETGLGWITLATLGFVPFSSLLVNQFALLLPAIEMIFLGFALAERLTFLQKTKSEAERKALQGELYRIQNEELSVANQEIRRQQSEILVQAAEIQEMNTQVTTLNIFLQQQNQDLAETNRQKDELLGIVAHDLKNPIGSIRGFAELLETKIASSEEIPVIIRHISATANRMLDLVSNLLEINRLESGSVQFQMIDVDIAPIAEETVAQYQAPALAKQITLHFQNLAHSQTAFVDERSILQIFDNLISNAVKYSPHGKNVFVLLTSNTNVVRLEVNDEGPGISEEDMPRLFGKFTRLSAQPTGGEHSTGLGLSIVKKMVEAMNGKVWCESEVGKGATFIVELPKSI